MVSGMPLFSMNLSEYSTSLSKKPHFVDSKPYNTTAINGKTAFLDCYVEDIGDKLVSWIRHDNLNLLTAGLSTYSTDKRYSSVLYKPEGRWSLKVKR